MIYSNESHHPQPSPPRLFFCYWDWCRLTFSTVDELTSHVRYDHIWKLQPMSKREIMLMRREDAKAAQSMSDSFSSSVLVHHHEDRSQLTFADSAHKSLPASRSLDLPQAHAPILSPGPLTPLTIHNPTSPFPPERTPSSPIAHGVDLDQGPAMLQTTPTRHEFSNFAQLSSPSDTSSITSLPQSPDLSTLSLRPNLMAQIDAFDQRHSRLLEVTQGDRPPLLHHSHSQSSSSSQDAVERQLTQDDVIDVSVQIERPEVVQSGATEGAILSTSESEDPARMISSIIADADADLQWPESEPEFTPANRSPQISPAAVGEAAEQLEYRSPLVVLQSNRGTSFRSGTLYISPSPQRTKSRSAPQSPQRVVYSPQVSQETSSSGVSQSSDSRPLVLQTQAPYQSQSYDLSPSQA